MSFEKEEFSSCFEFLRFRSSLSGFENISKSLESSSLLLFEWKKSSSFSFE